MDEEGNVDLESSSERKVDITTEDGNAETRKRWKCKQCEKIFTQNAGLYNHMKRKHGMVVYAKASISCREEGCAFKCSMREKLQAHLVSAHKKPLAFSTLKFSSMKEFEEWKELFEKQDKCRFVKKSGTRIRRNTGDKHTYLYCSRSGTFVSNSTGKRNQMKKGTCKISNYCTASIDCIEQQNGVVIAKLCSTHYGHEPSVEYLRLTKSDKSNIAVKLAQGLPRDMVIDNVRASVGENVDRVHFLTIKDIRNIERSYGIKSETKQRASMCGFSSVHIWVQDMKNLGDESPIQFYKQKFEPVKDCPSNQSFCLEHGDFCLVLITKGQNEILKKFGPNGVFYITWMSISNGYDLSLLTLMVADDLNEGFPVAYMICNKVTKEVEVLFFDILKVKVGVFSARAILTDDKKTLYDNWCDVMGFVPYHLLSNRYVDADWRDRLISVQNEDLQCAIYEVLYSYLSSTDSTNFEENLKMFSKHLKGSEETSVFGTYFEDNYLHRVHLWAGCYDKKNVGVNEHLNLDSVYNELLTVCNNKGKFSKLLDKTLQGLLTIVRDRQYNRNSKITKQAHELNHHHNVSLNINIEGIEELENRKWQIKSETGSLVFTVNRKTYVCSSKCPLICSDCKLCAHMFECTCKVYNFDRTMCKHIHSVGRLFRKNNVVIPGMEVDINEPEIIELDDRAPEEAMNEDDTDVRTPVILEVATGEERFGILQKPSKKPKMAKKVVEIVKSIESEISKVEDKPLLRKIFMKLKKVQSMMDKESEDVSEEEEEDEEEDNQPKRSRGRPKKEDGKILTPQQEEKKEKRKVGRPRKYKETHKVQPPGVKRPRGRPRLTPGVEPEPKDTDYEPKMAKLHPDVGSETVNVRRSLRKIKKSIKLASEENVAAELTEEESHEENNDVEEESEETEQTPREVKSEQAEDKGNVTENGHDNTVETVTKENGEADSNAENNIEESENTNREGNGTDSENAKDSSEIKEVENLVDCEDENDITNKTLDKVKDNTESESDIVIIHESKKDSGSENKTKENGN